MRALVWFCWIGWLTHLARGADVETILERHVQAIGADAFRKQSTRLLNGRLSLPTVGRDAWVEVRAAAPDRIVTRIDHPVLGRSAFGSDGAVAWSERPGLGARRYTGRARRYALEEGRFYRDIEIAQRHTQWVLRGELSIDGYDVYHLSARDALDEPVDFYIDRETYFLIRLETPYWAGETTDRVVYKMTDYRQVEGFWTPFHVALTEPELLAFDFTVVEVQFDVSHPPDAFRLPEWLLD